MELYLFFTAFILTFTFLPPDTVPQPLPSDADIGIVRAPKQYELRAVKRD